MREILTNENEKSTQSFFETPEFFLERMHEYAVLTHNNFYILAKN
jgi:hypothetical protein